MSVKISGIVCCRNTDLLDYCWRESVQSLLGVCDEVVISDCDSSDGTTEAIKEWMTREPRIVYCNYPWTSPKGNTDWYVQWINFARRHATGDWAFFLDADELLHESSYPTVRRAAENGMVVRCKRYNFWRDAGHLIPHGECCGHEVIRGVPINLNCPSDYPHPDCGEAERRSKMFQDVWIMHYGFLREREAFFRKAKAVQEIWSGSYDKRLDEADKAGGAWMENPVVSPWINNLIVFYGTHPKLAEQWLHDRGYTLPNMSNETLVRKWQHVLDEAERIFSWTEPATLAYCCEVASKCTQMVELGTYFGKSAFVMLRANPSLHLWCVDHFQVAGTHHLCTNITLKDFIDQGRCELIQGDSLLGSHMLHHMAGKLDAVWVDDGHLTEDVKRDIRCFLPLLKSRGEIFGHDFDVPHNNVAIGVLQSLPSEQVTFPVPRVWSHIKP